MPDSALRPMFDRIHADGHIPDPEMRREVDSIQAIPFDDTVAEAPHARAKRCQGRTTGGKWAWLASTMRLDQNLQDLKEMLPVVGADLNVLWKTHKSLLQWRERRVGRNFRLPPATLCCAHGALIQWIRCQGFDLFNNPSLPIELLISQQFKFARKGERFREKRKTKVGCKGGVGLLLVNLGF